MNLHVISIALAATLLICSCATGNKQESRDFYGRHEKKIREVLANYEQLYSQNPFNLGFSDREFTKVGIDIMTDTVRYALTNLQSAELFRQAVLGFHYDSLSLIRLYTDLHDIRCIWLGREEIYQTGKKEMITYLSFRPAASWNPFLDRKFKTLVFFRHGYLNDAMKAELEKSGFMMIEEDVYFKILGKFR